MAEPSYDYHKDFNPKHVERAAAAGREEPADLRRDPVYVYNEDIVLAVNVALATRRPILVRGRSGTGKSSLARSAAHFLGWRYYERVVTSRTQARDLLWEVDLLRRLRDAQARVEVEDYRPYIVPGVLWWAFDPESAAWRGGDPVPGQKPPLDDPSTTEHPRAVVLLDEIDKADPDVPNNLLVPLGSLTFEVEEIGVAVSTSRDRAPLVFLTTNEERELPPAFLRRCIELNLPQPTPRRLTDIVRAHFPELAKKRIDAITTALFSGPQGEPYEADEEVDVSPAELLDAVRAAERLGVAPDSPTWEALTRSTVWKFGRRRSGEAREG